MKSSEKGDGTSKARSQSPFSEGSDGRIGKNGPMSELDLHFVDETVARLGRRPEAVIPILQAIQEHYRYLPREALELVCAQTDITAAAVAGVSTFYSQFRHRPVGRHTISVCHGTACHVKNAGLVQDELERHLGLKNGEDTDADKLIHRGKSGLPGLLHARPRDEDRTDRLRPSDAADGTRSLARLPSPSA